MGTRLYPQTKNPQILETLAEVAPGTYTALSAIEDAAQAQINEVYALVEAAQAAGGSYEGAYTECEAIREREYHEATVTRDLARLRAFLFDGWLKLTHDTVVYLRDTLGLDPVCGAVEEPEYNQHHLEMVLVHQGVHLPKGIKVQDLEGLCWS